MIKNGIDVSEHQGVIDWTKVNTDFAIIRAGYGKSAAQKDKRFEENYAGCKAKNIPVGAYWYSYAVSVDEAREEAAACLEVIGGKKFEYPVYFDIEEQRQLVLGKEMCSEIAGTFLETLEKAGYWVGVYSSRYELEKYLSDEIRSLYVVWVAEYGVSKTSYSGQFGMWQRSSTGSVTGISGNVDLDVCYANYPVEIKSAGKNGYSVESAVPEKSVVKVTVETEGKTYEGEITERVKS